MPMTGPFPGHYRFESNEALGREGRGNPKCEVRRMPGASPRGRHVYSRAPPCDALKPRRGGTGCAGDLHAAPMGLRTVLLACPFYKHGAPTELTARSAAFRRLWAAEPPNSMNGVAGFPRCLGNWCFCSLKAALLFALRISAFFRPSGFGFRISNRPRGSLRGLPQHRVLLSPVRIRAGIIQVVVQAAALRTAQGAIDD